MRDYTFSFEALTKFSQSDPYNFVPPYAQNLLFELQRHKKELRFPAVEKDIGSLLGFLLSLTGAKTVFEMGSGYGHSAFWYFAAANETLERVVLTEKREDLAEVFNRLPWPVNWKNRIDYHQGDAFEKLIREKGPYDLFFVDGVKADYRKFVQAALPKLSSNGIIAIDNSYWRGSFLNEEVRSRKMSAAKVYELHQWIASRKEIQAVFIPFIDGLTLIKKRP